MKVTLGEIFVRWFETTNPHLYEKNLKKAEINKEMAEYVNDVLLEHMETMQRSFEASPDPNTTDEDENRWEDEGGFTEE